MNRFDLEKHLEKEHKRTPFSEYLREIVYGGNDGIITTFAVVAGFAGAALDPATSSIPAITVLLFGLANLFADGLSMSLGSFLSLRAEKDLYASEKAKETHEIQHEPEMEASETMEILRQRGFSPADARTLTSIYRKNPSYWAEFMMRDELNMQNPEGENSAGVAIATFLAFTGFGIIPLLPYIFRLGRPVFAYSVASTAAALLLLGILRAAISRKKALYGIAETLFLGVIAAATAYGVGTFFRL